MSPAPPAMSQDMEVHSADAGELIDDCAGSIEDFRRTEHIELIRRAKVWRPGGLGRSASFIMRCCEFGSRRRVAEVLGDQLIGAVVVEEEAFGQSATGSRRRTKRAW